MLMPVTHSVEKHCLPTLTSPVKLKPQKQLTHQKHLKWKLPSISELLTGLIKCLRYPVLSQFSKLLKLVENFQCLSFMIFQTEIVMHLLPTEKSCVRTPTAPTVWPHIKPNMLIRLLKSLKNTQMFQLLPLLNQIHFQILQPIWATQNANKLKKPTKRVSAILSNKLLP